MVSVYDRVGHEAGQSVPLNEENTPTWQTHTVKIYIAALYSDVSTYIIEPPEE